MRSRATKRRFRRGEAVVLARTTLRLGVYRRVPCVYRGGVEAWCLLASVFSTASRRFYLSVAQIYTEYCHYMYMYPYGVRIA